jgi:hypothetical protein
MNNRLDLNAIRQRAEAADVGPWFYEDGNIYTKTEIAPGCPGLISEFVYRDEAEFIAHARQDVPALLTEVERLRKELQAERDSMLLDVIEEAFGQRLDRNAEKYVQILRDKFGEVEDD